MSDPVLHKYFDFGDRALANVTLESGERVLLTIVPAGFAVHRLHLFGMIPGRCLFGANDVAMQADDQRAHARHAAVAAAAARQGQAPGRFGDARVPRRRHSRPHAAAENKPIPGKVDALDLENPPERPLSLFTRLALTARDADDLVRLFERTRNTSADTALSFRRLHRALAQMHGGFRRGHEPA